MRYPEDELYHLIQVNNPKAIINRKTVKVAKSPRLGYRLVNSTGIAYASIR